MRLSLAADDLIILPQKRFFVKHFFEKLLKFYELGALRTSQCQLVFSASIGSFQGLPAEISEVILLPQRLALKYNTTPRCACQHFLSSFFQFLCGGVNSLSQSLTALPAPSEREPLAWRESFWLKCKAACTGVPLPSCRFASSHLPQGDGFLPRVWLRKLIFVYNNCLFLTRRRAERIMESFQYPV